MDMILNTDFFKGLIGTIVGTIVFGVGYTGFMRYFRPNNFSWGSSAIAVFTYFCFTFIFFKFFIN